MKQLVVSISAKKTKALTGIWRIGPPIDLILFFGKDHCKTSYESEINRMHCPPSLRTEKDTYVNP